MSLKWERVEFSSWEESCWNCAVKRGWSELIEKQSFPFQCVHRQDLKGNQKVCVGWKHKLDDFKNK